MTHFKTIFGIDLRSLALFRICMGSVVLADLINRSFDIASHYSDSGVLSRADLLSNISSFRFSLYFINGTIAFQTVLFVITALAALAIVLGYRTRIATFVCWILILSLQNRNPVLLQGGDNLILMLLFWSLFLPLGARYSIDEALNKKPVETNQYFSLATMALLIQCMSVYFFSAFLKSGSEWIPDGTAVYYALQLDILATPIGVWFNQFETLQHYLSYYVWYLELLGPILIFSPFLFLPARLAIMAMLFTMHIGFFACLEIGLFPFISMTTILAFTPSWLWDKLSNRVHADKKRNIIIYYDEDCGFCKKTCLILRSILLLRKTPIIPAQTKNEIHEILVKNNSWVVQDFDGSTHTCWNAMEVLFKRSIFFWPLGYLINIGPTRYIGKQIYASIAKNRPFLSKLSGILLPYRHQQIQLSVNTEFLAGVLMVYIFYFNLTTLPKFPYKFPTQLSSINDSLRFDQIWNMFAPYPLKNDGWHVMRGMLRDKTIVDPYKGTEGEPSWQKPPYASKIYEGQRWRKYFLRTSSSNSSRYLLYYGKYMCRKWNYKKSKDKELLGFRIYFNLERTLPNYKQAPIKRNLLWEHWCFNSDDIKKFPKYKR